MSDKLREASRELVDASRLFNEALSGNWMNTARAQWLVAIDHVESALAEKTAERPQLSAEQVRERVTLLRRYEFKGNGPFVKLEDVMLLLPSALLTGVAEKVSPAPIAHIVGEGGKCWCGERHANYHKPDCKYQETGTCKCAAPAAPPVLQASEYCEKHAKEREFLIKNSSFVVSCPACAIDNAERAAFEKVVYMLQGMQTDAVNMVSRGNVIDRVRALADSPVSGATKEKAG